MENDSETLDTIERRNPMKLVRGVELALLKLAPFVVDGQPCAAQIGYPWAAGGLKVYTRLRPMGLCHAESFEMEAGPLDLRWVW